MRVAVHESPAGKPAGPDRHENDQGQLSMYSEIISMCKDVPCRNELLEPCAISYMISEDYDIDYDIICLELAMIS